MHRYIIRRLLLIIPTLLLVIAVVFFILNITPGDPARIILGQNATQEAVDSLNETLGLNRPLWQRYLSYLGGIVRLDFGDSYRDGQPVMAELLIKFPTTLKLALLSSITSIVLGIPLGILSAVKEHSALDITLTVSAMFLASMPSFWLGLMLILIFSLNLRLLPTSGIGGIEHYIMPVLTQSLASAAFMSRMTRATMLETMRQDYIRTAKAKGASPQRIIWKHAIKNALMPVITMVGMSFASMLGGSMIVEVVFGLPGVGQHILQAIRMKDLPVVMGSTVLLATLFMLIMLAVDLVYAFIDPRIKAQFQQ